MEFYVASFSTETVRREFAFLSPLASFDELAVLDSLRERKPPPLRLAAPHHFKSLDPISPRHMLLAFLLQSFRTVLEMFPFIRSFAFSPPPSPPPLAISTLSGPPLEFGGDLHLNGLLERLLYD